ncbi:MAG: hypothetical protein JSV94_05330 [Methanobacteriota archaeon]|nr:MAG: hypothetical protein JSV94_05330 [Euryarchaeota archaeon]
MPGVPKNVSALPPGWRGDYSWFEKPRGYYLFFIVFMVLMFLLVGSVKLAWEGELIASAALGLTFTLSILAIWWFKFRIRR